MERGGESEIEKDKRKCRAPQTGEGDFIAEGTTEEKLRGPGMRKKERVTECVDERREGQRGGSPRGRRALDEERGGGVKSGDLQVQHEQAVTLMVH